MTEWLSARSCLAVLLVALAALTQVMAAPPSDLIEKLTSEEFKVREEAQAALLAWGLKNKEGGIDGIYEVYRDTDDPEIRQRCYAILREMMSDAYQRSGQGFMGIVMADVTKRMDDLQAEQAGVRIAWLIPCLAAEKAGLRVNDIIFEIDAIKKLGADPIAEIREHVSSLKPGTPIRLKILRGKEFMEINMVIGRRPAAAENADFGAWPRERIEKSLKEEQEKYVQSWLAEREKVRR